MGSGPLGGSIDRERLTNYPRIVLALFVVITAWWMLSGDGLLDRGGQPIGADFLTFYAASSSLHAQPAAELYDVSAQYAEQQRVIGADVEALPWHYPPPAMLLVWPLAWLPYLAALALWTALSLAVYVVVVRSIDRDVTALALALAFPGLLQNLLHGQNGCISLGLLSGALLVDKRPWAGGVLMGALVYKPHLLPLAGVALVAAQNWRALAAMAATAAVLCAASLPLGLETWAAFFDNIPHAWSVLAERRVDMSKVTTVAGAALHIGLPATVAQILQGLCTVGAAGAVGWAWWHDLPAKGGALATGALLATPFSFEYDLVLLAIPLLIIGSQRREADRALLVAGWSVPMLAPALASLVPVQTAPVVLAAILWRCCSTAPATTGAGAPGPH